MKLEKIHIHYGSIKRVTTNLKLNIGGELMKLGTSKIALGFGVIALLLSFLLTKAVLTGEDLLFDIYVESFLVSLFNDSTQPFFSTVTPLGDKAGVITVGVIFLLWLWWRTKDYAALATGGIAVAVGNELNKFLKNTIGRPRPELEHLDKVESLSFPSGHAMIAIILYTFIAYFSIKQINSLAWRWGVGVAAGVLIVLIGISRVILQVHYPTDVVGGFALAICGFY